MQAICPFASQCKKTPAECEHTVPHEYHPMKGCGNTQCPHAPGKMLTPFEAEEAVSKGRIDQTMKSCSCEEIKE